jgi:ABC-2 type transport system ATP-binding protein
MASVIETWDLTRTFAGTNAVEGVTIDVRAGEVLALLGPNGAGKTTTMRLLNGVLHPDSGRSTVCGLDPAVDGDAVRARTGVLTEQAGLDERLTARENLLITARIRHLGPSAAGRAEALLERFGMAARADDLVRGFSTGQRKRVALARALLHEPDVLFLDEPTSGLDPEAIRDVLDLIAELAAEGRTIVLCTHFLGEADRLAHRMAVMLNGKVQAFGTTADLAAAMWHGTAVNLEVRPDQVEIAGALATQAAGIIGCATDGDHLVVRVNDRADTAALVSLLTTRGIDVFAVVPRPATLEDVYFEVLARQVA